MATATNPGAQTERRGGAGPVRGLLGDKTSPAAFFFPSIAVNRWVRLRDATS
jgi:hypothetical protein